MRTLSGMMLAAVIAFLAGCGGSDSPKAEPKAAPTDPNKKDADPGTTPPKDAPKTDGPKKSDPPGPLVAWEMDVAKHAIPTAPVSGTLGGAAFTPEAQFMGDTLTFRVLRQGIPERQVSLKLSPEQAKAAAAGLKLTVNKDQPQGPDVPTVTAEVTTGAPKAETKASAYVNGYALTLELGKREKDRLPGKIYLSLPTDAKDFLAGTFSAEWVRPVSVPPGPEDAPFVQGTVTLAGAGPDAQVKVGYAGEPKPNELAFDVIQMPFVGPNQSARSDHAKPRVTTFVSAEAAGKPARYEHTRLAPGRYLVFAAVEGGPAVWKWLTVPADGQLTADFALDATKTGKLEVTLPADVKDKVQAVPADDPATPIPPAVASGVAFSFGLEAEPKDGKAAFANLGPGRYEVRAGDLAGTVEVKAGETAKLELKKK